MSAAGLAFARSGNPHAGRQPAWPAFRPQDRATMVFDGKQRVVEDHRKEERTLLAALPPYRVSR
jgi:carboxylesterase type B